MYERLDTERAGREDRHLSGRYQQYRERTSESIRADVAETGRRDGDEGGSGVYPRLKKVA